MINKYGQLKEDLKIGLYEKLSTLKELRDIFEKENPKMKAFDIQNKVNSRPARILDTNGKCSLGLITQTDLQSKRLNPLPQVRQQ